MHNNNDHEKLLSVSMDTIKTVATVAMTEYEQQLTQ